MLLRDAPLEDDEPDQGMGIQLIDPPARWTELFEP